MAVYDILPSSNLTDSDIRDTLRAGGGAVDFDSRSWFKQEAHINLYSRYKPICHPEILSPVDFYKGVYSMEPDRNGDCGLWIEDKVAYPIGGSLSSKCSAIQDASGNTWSYRHPDGSFNEPLRSSDFRGYNDKAVPPIIAEIAGGTIQINNTSNQYLHINFTCDPGNSADNLQVIDLKGNTNVDFMRLKLIGCLVDYNGTPLAISESSDFVMDDSDNYNATILSFDVSGLSQLQQGASHKIYLCLRHIGEDGDSHLIPLPKSVRSDLFNQMPVNLQIISSPGGGGGGVANPGNDIAFSPGLYGDFELAKDCTEEFAGNKQLRNTTGDVVIRCTLTNTSQRDAIFHKENFSASNYWSGTKTVSPSGMSYELPSGGSFINPVKQIIVPADDYVEVYFYFSQLLSNVRETGIHNSVEIDFKRSNVPIWNGAVYYAYGDQGWVMR